MSVGHFVAEGGISSVLGQEVLVILQGVIEHLLAQALQAGGIEQGVLADEGEVVVDGLAGLLEVLFGPVAFLACLGGVGLCPIALAASVGGIFLGALALDRAHLRDWLLRDATAR